METSPLELTIRVGLAEMLYFARRYDESIQECRKMLALDPAFQRAYGELTRNYESMGRYDSAALAMAEFWSLRGDPKSGEDLRRASAGSGKEGYLGWFAAHGWLAPWSLAQLGKVDEAVGALEHAYSQRRGDMIFLAVNPGLDPLRTDPRFRDLVRRVGIRAH